MAPRRPTARVLTLAAGALFALAACGPRLNSQDDAGDGGASDVRTCTVPVPVVRPLAERMPYTVATVRGTAMNARRVGVFGGGNPRFSAVVPGGSFCVDVPVAAAGEYTFEVVAYDEAGNASCMGAFVSTVIDRSAPRIAGAITCNDVDPAMCDANGVCGNPCRPNCGTRRCGDDGCGGACGTCMAGQACNVATGACVAAPLDGGVRDAAVDSGTRDTGITDPCRAATRCGTCTPMSGCGWCRRTNACMAGTSGGAAGTTCTGADWAWVSSMCPDGG